MSEKLLLTLGCAPGDIVCLTAFARDLSITFPGRFELHVATHAHSLWFHNPYITSAHHLSRLPKGSNGIRLGYGKYIRQADTKKLHFITAFHREFERLKGVKVPCLLPKGDLYLSQDKYKEPPISGRYWIVLAGGKSDFTTKIWSAKRWQEVIYGLRDRGIKTVQCGALDHGHKHPMLDGALNLVDSTSLRDLLWLIYHADGVICPITFAMHAAAAFDKPCVVLAGGREHWWWEAYVNVAGVEAFGPLSPPVKVPHRFLHTQGLLDCCKTRGCWKNKVLQSSKDKHHSYCKQPTVDGYGQALPRCLEMITTEHVIEAVMSYYGDGTLPPIGDPKQIVLPEAPAPPKRPISVPTRRPIDLFGAPEAILAAAKQQNTDGELALVGQLDGHRGQPKAKTVADPLDDPLIGGRFTICVLCYGDYHPMHKLCIGSIIRTVPPSRRQLRVITNEVCFETQKMLQELRERGEIHTLVFNPDNRKKYPAMRQLFYDQDNPIEDKWIIWFDDDSIANRDDRWASKLACKIIDSYPSGARLIGDKRFWTLKPAQFEWIRKRPWYTERPFQAKNGHAAPNGNKVFFAAGGFWALETETMRRADIPDPEIGHNGGDYMVGAQVWQQGGTTAGWNSRKQFVFTSSVGRRGLVEHHTGMTNEGWKPGGVPKIQRHRV